MLRVTRKGELFREVEMFSPVHDLAVGISRLLSAEWWPSDKAFEHDCSNGPPIAKVGITLTMENFRGDIVWGTDSRVRHCSARFTPGIDLSSIGYSQVDSIREETGVSVLVLGGGISEKCLIISIVMLLLSTGRKTKVCKLDVAASV